MMMMMMMMMRRTKGLSLSNFSFIKIPWNIQTYQMNPIHHSREEWRRRQKGGGFIPSQTTWPRNCDAKLLSCTGILGDKVKWCCGDDMRGSFWQGRADVFGNFLHVPWKKAVFRGTCRMDVARAKIWKYWCWTQFCFVLLPLYIISTEKLLRHNLALKRKTIFKIMYSPVENEKTVLNSSW